MRLILNCLHLDQKQMYAEVYCCQEQHVEVFVTSGSHMGKLEQVICRGGGIRARGYRLVSRLMEVQGARNSPVRVTGVVLAAGVGGWTFLALGLHFEHVQMSVRSG